MFNLSKLAKLFYPYRSLPPNGLVSKHIFSPISNISLVNVQREYFGRPKQAKGTAKKDETKARAMGDEKEARSSLEDEEALKIKKKVEVEKTRMQKERGEVPHIKSQLKIFEYKLTRKDLDEKLSDLRIERLSLLETDEAKRGHFEKVVEKAALAKEKETEEYQNKKREARKKYANKLRNRVTATLNTVPDVTFPRLRRKVGKDSQFFFVKNQIK